MTRKELKAKAREQLGGKIFGNNWLMAILVFIVYGAVIADAGTILPGLGAVLISGPMTYGLHALFLKQARDGEQMDIGGLFSGFTKDFSQTFLLGLLITIFTALWSLLFVIPGIVKAYAYSMAWNVKYDHPEYDWRQCINESKTLMKGNKWKLFVLDLSFIGWIIVGALCFCVGSFWVSTYRQAAKAQFYESIKSPVVIE